MSRVVIPLERARNYRESARAVSEVLGRAIRTRVGGGVITNAWAIPMLRVFWNAVCEVKDGQVPQDPMKSASLYLVAAQVYRIAVVGGERPRSEMEAWFVKARDITNTLGSSRTYPAEELPFLAELKNFYSELERKGIEELDASLRPCHDDDDD